MVRKYIFGEPIETDAVVKEIASSAWSDGVFQKKEDGFHYSLKEDEIVYGLGENVRGINKRGWRYISNCSDNPNHCENTNSLYGAHNFIMVGDGVRETYGLFVDTPGKVTFDVGYADIDELWTSVEEENFKLYVEMQMGTVHIFLREGYLFPVAKGGKCVEDVDFEDLTLYSFGKEIKPYEYYLDDGETKDFAMESHIRMLSC